MFSKKDVFKSLQWSFLQQISIQVLGFIVSIVLARLLPVTDFGIIGKIYVFTTIGIVLIDSGLSTSIIRSKTIDDISLNSVFCANVVFSLLFYIIIFLLAPIIANFYDDQILVLIIRIFCISLVISSLFTIQKAILTRDLDFKSIGIISVIAMVISSLVGVLMAVLGYGVWSLIAINILNALISLIIYYYYSRWRPNFSFSFIVFKEHINFGYKLLLASLLDAVFSNSSYVIIGKIYNSFTLGLFTRADGLRKITVLGISTPLKSILLPILSSIQDNETKLKTIYIFILQIALLIVTPILLFLTVYADQIFNILYGSKWDGAVPFFKILCLSSILYPISTYVVSFLNVKGRSDLVLKIESIKKIAIILAFILTWITRDIYMLLWSLLIISVIDFIINTIALKLVLNITYLFQIKKIFTILVINFCAISVLYFFLDVVFLDYTKSLLALVIGVIMLPSLNFLFLYIVNPKLIYQVKLIILNRNSGL
jgi:O-antigen/teichoic acid export membrane protein